MRSLRLPVAALVAAALSACAANPPVSGRVGDFQYARDVAPRTTTAAAQGKGEVTVVWRFGTPEWVDTMCRNAGQQAKVHGCAMLDERGERCLMFLVEPRHFQDVDRLAVMGHELWHCQGSRHS